MQTETKYKWKAEKGDGTIVDTIRNTKHILAGKCGGVGFILGGDEIQVYGNKGKYTIEEIKDACNKWWEYWKDYWKKRETSEAYDTIIIIQKESVNLILALSANPNS